jgi:methyltransferase (TIGR00027 family)
MHTSQASRTAQSMATFRALESARPKGARSFSDPFAAGFLSPTTRALVRIAEQFPPLMGLLVKLIDRRWPGARPSGVARTTMIDWAIREACTEGAKQVVILGAGYDARPYRMEELKETRVFEVDRLETQRIKQECLSRVLRPLPPQVTFVEMDFREQSLARTLTRSGFESRRRTFFIWEGVTHYLDAEAVDATMRFVGSCAAGGRIAFTYIHRGLLDGSGTFTISPNVVRLLKHAGEPWKFGFYPAELRAYLRERGLELIEDLGAVEYGARFMGATKEQMKGYDFYHVAIASI